ncbi:MAG: hypothetical protein JWO38_4209 [Gemmataceae bacterium]|nr:hypothetical protein [Gemmataceae bacterium]
MLSHPFGVKTEAKGRGRTEDFDEATTPLITDGPEEFRGFLFVRLVHAAGSGWEAAVGGSIGGNREETGVWNPGRMSGASSSSAAKYTRI